jgi:cobalt-zinc-cadmium efflux system protein
LLTSTGSFTNRIPTQRFTYGLRGSSILAALINGAVLLLVTGGIAWESVQRLFEPVPVAAGTVIAVAALGIVVNAATAWLFQAGRKDDLNIRAAFLHMAADALVSLGVVLAGIGIVYTGWLWLDPAVSLLVAAVIIAGTWSFCVILCDWPLMRCLEALRLISCDCTSPDYLALPKCMIFTFGA